MRITLLLLGVLLLNGCASQQLAQKTWNWVLTNPGGVQTGATGYTTGVTTTQYTINGEGYQVITPVR